MATQQEILQLVFNVLGQESVDKLRASMDAAAKSASGLTPEMQAASAEIDKLTTNASKIESFAALKASVTDTGLRLQAAQSLRDGTLGDAQQPGSALERALIGQGGQAGEAGGVEVFHKPCECSARNMNAASEFAGCCAESRVDPARCLVRD